MEPKRGCSEILDLDMPILEASNMGSCLLCWPLQQDRLSPRDPAVAGGWASLDVTGQLPPILLGPLELLSSPPGKASDLLTKDCPPLELLTSGSSILIGRPPPGARSQLCRPPPPPPTLYPSALPAPLHSHFYQIKHVLLVRLVLQGVTECPPWLGE